MDERNTFLLLPTSTGQGVLVQRDQVIGARANGPTEGAILYTQAGPAIYTSLSTKDVGRLFGAQVVEGAH